jgi:hypothetical protein
MELRRTLARAATIALALPLLACGPVAARSSGWGTSSTIHLDVAGGTLDVTLRPDRGRALPLAGDGSHTWVYGGDTAALVGQPYSIELRNRTRERLKVVVSVDGLNVYGREVVAGAASRDVGSILSPWDDRSLPGWQLDDERAQRFVFSPPEWSEGEGRTDSHIGLVVVQVYRERMELDLCCARQAPAAEPEDAPAGAPETRADSSAGAEAPKMQRAPIGTTAGDDVDSRVRTVSFAPATDYPEAWAVIDYGQNRQAWHPRPRVRHDEQLLGLHLDDDSDGTRIVAVTPGSAADRAGLEAQDVILRIDTTFEPSPEATRRILRDKDPGDYTFLRVRRGANELAVKIRT